LIEYTTPLSGFDRTVAVPVDVLVVELNEPVYDAGETT
jgi:hypothetical protein